MAIDLNEAALSVYRHNFASDDSLVLPRDICTLKLDWFEEHPFHVWMMAPPCQPYTIQGKGLDQTDTRASPLTHLTEVLASLSSGALPRFLCLENVPPFIHSNSYLGLKETLLQRGYRIEESLVNSMEDGFPNARRRVCVVAQLGQPVSAAPPEKKFVLYPPLATFLDDEVSEQLFLAKATTAKSSFLASDIVHATTKECWHFHRIAVNEDRHYTMCFTKAYGRFFNGTGSLLALPGEGVRYFSPTEIARIMGFKTTGCPKNRVSYTDPNNECHLCLPATVPLCHGCDLHTNVQPEKHAQWPCTCKTIDFPESLTLKTRWSLLGNSLNPQVRHRHTCRFAQHKGVFAAVLRSATTEVSPMLLRIVQCAN